MTIGVFVHIPRTGGTSITKALGIQKPRLRRHLDRYGPVITFGHRRLPNLQLPEGAFTFSFCRNPYDRAVSMWAFSRRAKGQPDMTFPEFCANLENWTWGQRVRVPQAVWMGDANPDFLGRFENLHQDFDKLCDALGMERRNLPHLNATDRGPCREHYDERAQDIIRAYYAQDFERFGYDADHLPDGEEAD